MSISFTGRVANPNYLNMLAPCIASKNTDVFYQICATVLNDFRKSIETESELNAHPLALYAGNEGNYFSPNDDCICLDFNQALRESTDLNSVDLLLGSLGHELGHFYVMRLSNYYKKNIHILWNELMADFTGGFLFGLDQDNDVRTRDLNLDGRKRYFPYRRKSVYPAIPGTNEGYREQLDGKHPFCALRIAAIEMGFNKGVYLKDFALPLGLTENLATVYDTFMEQMCNYFNSNVNIQYIVKDLLNYNPSSAVIPPSPTFFLK